MIKASNSHQVLISDLLIRPFEWAGFGSQDLDSSQNLKNKKEQVLNLPEWPATRVFGTVIIPNQSLHINSFLDV